MKLAIQTNLPQQALVVPLFEMDRDVRDVTPVSCSGQVDQNTAVQALEARSWSQESTPCHCPSIILSHQRIIHNNSITITTGMMYDDVIILLSSYDILCFDEAMLPIDTERLHSALQNQGLGSWCSWCSWHCHGIALGSCR